MIKIYWGYYTLWMSTGVLRSPTADYSTQRSQGYIPDCLEHLSREEKIWNKRLFIPQSADGEGNHSSYIAPVTTWRLWQSQNLQPELLGLTPGVWKQIPNLQLRGAVSVEPCSARHSCMAEWDSGILCTFPALALQEGKELIYHGRPNKQ